MTTRRFTQGQIEAVLGDLGFAFSSHGEVSGPLGFSSLRSPRPSGIYFLAGSARLPDSARGSLVLVAPDGAEHDPGNAYITLANPQFAFYALMDATVRPHAEPGIHPTAIIAAGAKVSPVASIGPYCVVEAWVEVGACCRLDSHVVLKDGTRLGERVVIEPHSTIGATGVAWSWNDAGTVRLMQPQTGGVEIGDDVFLGSDVSIVRGSVNEATVIGNHTAVAHGSKIGHGSRLGMHCHLANNVSLAGNVDVGNRVFFGSGATVRPRTAIADGVVVGAGAVVVKDIETPGVVVGGVPAREMAAAGGKLSGVPALPGE